MDLKRTNVARGLPENEGASSSSSSSRKSKKNRNINPIGNQMWKNPDRHKLFKLGSHGFDATVIDAGKQLLKAGMLGANQAGLYKPNKGGAAPSSPNKVPKSMQLVMS
jgi:hypothetical protein